MNYKESIVHVYDIIEKAPVAMALTTGDELMFECINQPMLEIIHKSKPDEVIGKGFKDVLPELVGQPVFQEIQKVFLTGQIFQGTELEIDIAHNASIERRFFNITFSRVVSFDGKYSVLHIATDVTGQVLNRRKIEESEAKLRSILNSAPTAMAVFAGDDLIVENPNQLMIEVMAAGPDIEGKSFRKLLAGLVEEEQKFIRIIDRVRETGQPFEAKDVRVNFKTGKKVRYFSINFIPLFDETRQVYAVLDVSVDVTAQVETRFDLERKEEVLATALEQIRLSKEAAELGTFDLDLKANTLHWDERCRTLFGIRHHEAVTYDNDFVPGLHPADKSRILSIIDKSLNKAESNGDYDVEYRTVGAEDGKIRWIRAKGKVYFDDDDKPVRFIGSVLDITSQVLAIQQIEQTVEARTRELAQTNDALLLANKELERSNQTLNEFAYVASHDLKEPIRKIRFFTNMLNDDLIDRLTVENKRTIEKISASAERMSSLVDDLLSYSLVSDRPAKMERISLNDVVNNVLEDLDLNIEQSGAKINVGELPVISGFRRQLEQMFQNLLTNALKFHKSDENPTIAIFEDENEANNASYYVIVVQDNGIGFQQEFAEKIFKIFFRLHRREIYGGSGVGLSIVKKIVDNHQARIEVNSVPGAGATFRLFFPKPA